jgi:hypothetical protein
VFPDSRQIQLSERSADSNEWYTIPKPLYEVANALSN